MLSTLGTLIFIFFVVKENSRLEELEAAEKARTSPARSVVLVPDLQ